MNYFWEIVHWVIIPLLILTGAGYTGFCIAKRATGMAVFCAVWTMVNCVTFALHLVVVLR